MTIEINKAKISALKNSWSRIRILEKWILRKIDTLAKTKLHEGDVRCVKLFIFWIFTDHFSALISLFLLNILIFLCFSPFSPF